MSLGRRIPDFLKLPWRMLRNRQRASSPFWRRYSVPCPIVFVDLRFGINHERKYVYIRMPKAANSSVAASLYASHTGQVVSNWDEVDSVKGRFLSPPSALSAAEVSALDGYRVFTVVRDPVRRVLSAYHNKIAGKRVQLAVVTKALKRPRNADVSLEEFVSYLEQGGLMADPHWMPQRMFIPHGFPMPSIIGKVESLDQDLPRILELFYPGQVRLADFRPHATKANTAPLDDGLRARLMRLYAIDYLTFGYAIP